MSSTDSSAPAAKPRATAGILKNVTSNWAALIVNTLLSFFIAPIVVHNLGSVYYGIWSLLMQFTGYLWLFDFGVRESVVKYVAQYHASDDHAELSTTIRTAITVYTFVSALGFAVAAMLGYALPVFFNIPGEAVATARVAAFLTGATIAQSFLSNVFAGVLMGLQKFYLVARTGILFSLARAAAIFLLLANGFGLIALAFVYLSMSLAYGLLMYRLCVTLLPGVTFRPMRTTRAGVVKLLNYGKWVLVSNIGDKVVFATDGIVIGVFLPIASLTYYAIAGTLISHLRSLIVAMASILNPLSSTLEARRESAALATVVRTGAKVAVMLGLPLCIGFIMLGQRFITLWMGPDYGPTASTVLTVLALGHIVGLPYSTISGVLYGVGRHRIVALSRVVEGACNLALSIVLVQSLGLVGVALGTTIPHVVMVGVVLPLMLPKLFPISLWDYYASTYLRPLLAAIPFWAACWWVDAVLRPPDVVRFLVAAALALVVYVVPAWFIALTPAERAHAMNALRRRTRRVNPVGATSVTLP